jgi:hypothetical protein
VTPGVHRVRKQSWRIGVRSAQAAFAMRARLRVAVEHELRQAFDRAFDKAAPDEAIVHIPRLELRLRVASLDALPDALAEAIDRELRLQPPTPPRETKVDRLQVLLGYLDSGILAWHAAHAEAASVSAELRATLLAELDAVARHGPAGAASFEQAVQFYFRLLELLPEEKWRQLAAFVSSATPEALNAPTATAAIVAALRKGVHFTAEKLPDELQPLAHSPRAAIAALATLRPSLRHQAHCLAAIVLTAARMAGAAVPVHPRGAPAPGLSQDPAGPIAQSSGSAAGADKQEPRPELAAQVLPLSRRQDPDAAQRFALMAGNAGLVLLHPYLLRLFEACEIYRPPHPIAVERAAALLHWIATGREELYEFELGFVKLLLGLRPESPLAVGEGLLGAREREEGEALLAAAIGHWKALGKTSIDGLRVSFLQRRGALREEETGWRLQLEPESFDVLLRHLPWGFATVKLPWMTRPLYTDWPTP